jgi:hypothetical protein
MGAENGSNLDSRDENISDGADKVPSSKPIVEDVCAEVAPNKEDDKTSKDYPVVDGAGKAVSVEISRTAERLDTAPMEGKNDSVTTSQKNVKQDAHVASDDSLKATTSLSTTLPIHVPPKALVHLEINVADKRVRPDVVGHEKPCVDGNDIAGKTREANQSAPDGSTIQTNAHTNVVAPKSHILQKDIKSSETEGHLTLPLNSLISKEKSNVGPSIVSPLNKKHETSVALHISSQPTPSSVDQDQITVRNMAGSIHAPKSSTVSSSGVKEEKTVPLQRVKKSHKSELEMKFAPYILPGEKSLDEARSRLKTAIEQTRLLRETFTERIYEKFRIVLKPVPKSSDPLFHDIHSNPKLAQQRLKQQISVLENEKEVEKKVSQQINLEFAAVNNTSDATAYLGGLPGVDNAEQLSWYGAGLSLVILPEDDANEAELVARGIKERSPIDPETGGKVKDISSAAAVAGAAMLDRVRKGSEIRKFRIQSQQSGKSGTDFFNLQLASSLLQSSTFQTTRTISLVSPKTRVVKREREPRTSKISRPKSATSLTSFLSISPDVEGLRPSGRPSAVVHALMNTNLKNSTSPTSKESPFRHTVRHPFPQSKGVKIKKHSQTLDAHNKQKILPSPSEANERKKKIATSSSNINPRKSDVRSTLQSLLRALVTDEDRKNEPNGSSKTNGRNRLKLKRKVSEIGILLKSRSVKQKTCISVQSQDSGGQTRIDPYLVLAVMQSLGLVQKTSSSFYDENDEDEDCAAIDSFVKGIATSDDKKSMTSGDITFSNIASIDFLPAFKPASVATELFDRNQNNINNVISLQSECAPSEARILNYSERSISTKVVKETNNTPTTADSADDVSPKSQSVNTKDTRNHVLEKSSNSSAPNKVLKENKGCPTKSLEQESSATKIQSQINHNSRDTINMVTNQKHQAYAALAAGLMTDQVSPAFYQLNSNQNNGIVSAANQVSLQRQDIQHIDSQNQFHPKPIQFLDSAQMQNRHRHQQAALHSGHFLHSGPGDVNDYFKTMHQVMPQSFLTSRPSDWFNIATQHNIIQGIPCPPNDPSTLPFFGNRNTQIMVTAEQQQLQSRLSSLPLSVPGVGPSQDRRELNEQVDKGSIRFPKSTSLPVGRVNEVTPVVDAEKKDDNRDRSKSATSTKVFGASSSAPSKAPADASKSKKQSVNLASGSQLKNNCSNSSNKMIKAPHSRDVMLSKTEVDKSTSDQCIMSKTASNLNPPVTLKEEKVDPLVSSGIGLKMILPSHPAILSEREAQMVAKGYIHEAIRKASKQDVAKDPLRVKENVDTANIALCEFLIKVGAAVPIPKALISNNLRDRLNASVFRASITNWIFKSDLSLSPLDIIVSIVTIWLWSHHEITFKKAFAKSGRLDVDPDCLWLIKAALEKATNVTVAKGLEPIMRQIHTQTSSTSDMNLISVKIAKLVSSTMNTGICLDKHVNAALPNLDCLLGYLDDLRMTALRFRCQERVLLASLLAKRTRMSEAFSNAYTSSMVRAGAALGYDDLEEIVQDELTQTSTQLPFDILMDATGAWEDPCRSKRGYGENMDSDALLKRAHARAMIQRSLKRLQDRYGIKGGTQTAGPYSEEFDQASQKSMSSPRPSPRSGSKRKASFSNAEFLKNMNAATTIALFNPTHFSAPFIWDDTAENSPYGRHGAVASGRLRSPSGIGDKLLSTSKRLKTTDDDAQDIRNTSAIEWEEVAQMFEDVKPTEKSSSSRANEHNVAVPLGSTIFAPFCRKINPEDLPSDSESDADEEDMNDDYFLSGHQKVLDSIKDKFDMMMKIRQEYNDRTRRLSFGR